jgi:hypothetical protein
LKRIILQKNTTLILSSVTGHYNKDKDKEMTLAPIENSLKLFKSFRVLALKHLTTQPSSAVKEK